MIYGPQGQSLGLWRQNWKFFPGRVYRVCKPQMQSGVQIEIECEMLTLTMQEIKMEMLDSEKFYTHFTHFMIGDHSKSFQNGLTRK